MFTIRNAGGPTAIRLGFAGAGNMAAALARGWAAVDAEEAAESSSLRIESMAFADSGSGRATELATELGGEAVSAVGALAERSNVLILAVKPSALDAVARELKGQLGEGFPLTISVLAGVRLDRLDTAFPDLGVLRVMPNLPVQVRRGVICYVPPGGDLPPAMDPELIDPRLALLGLLGTLVPLAEDQMEAAMAIMSCSPAYVALVAEALAAAGEREGLDHQLAHELVVDTLAGTAELLRQRNPEAIRRAVASPGGATEAGLDVLERREIGKALAEAVDASLDRMRR